MNAISVNDWHAPAPRMTATLALRDTAGVTKRNLLRILRTPRLLVIGTLQPALLLLLFRYVLGGAIKIPGGNYVDYVVPAVFLEAVLIGCMTTSIGLAQDLQSGIIDRFRSLPMARPAVLAGRTFADLMRSVLSLLIMVALGWAVGYRFHNSVPSVLAGLMVILIFGYSFTWVYASIGLATKDPETAQVAGILPFFILVFASNALVPLSTMPTWLQAFARNQPFSIAVSSALSVAERWARRSLGLANGSLVSCHLRSVLQPLSAPVPSHRLLRAWAARLPRPFTGAMVRFCGQRPTQGECGSNGDVRLPPKATALSRPTGRLVH